MNAILIQLLSRAFVKRVWLILGLAVLVAGCTTEHEVTPSAKPSDMNHAGQAGRDAPAKDPQALPGNHGSHTKMPMKAVTQRKLVVKNEPSHPKAGSPTKLVLQIPDDGGTPIKAFDVLHEKLVHLIVVREGLDEFAHLHPAVDESGMITIEYAFPKSGTYRLFADHQPRGNPPGLATGEIVITGDDESAASLLPNASNEVAAGDLQADIAIESGDQETTVRFRLVDGAGQAVVDLQPYLGAMGHLVIISADGREYVHAHPLSEDNTAPDGIVEFAAHFPNPGIYKMWGQFQRDDSVFTVPFVTKHPTSKPN